MGTDSPKKSCIRDPYFAKRAHEISSQKRSRNTKCQLHFHYQLGYGVYCSYQYSELQLSHPRAVTRHQPHLWRWYLFQRSAFFVAPGGFVVSRCTLSIMRTLIILTSLVGGLSFLVSYWGGGFQESCVALMETTVVAIKVLVVSFGGTGRVFLDEPLNHIL